MALITPQNSSEQTSENAAPLQSQNIVPTVAAQTAAVLGFKSFNVTLRDTTQDMPAYDSSFMEEYAGDDFHANLEAMRKNIFTMREYVHLLPSGEYISLYIAAQEVLLDPREFNNYLISLSDPATGLPSFVRQTMKDNYRAAILAYNYRGHVA